MGFHERCGQGEITDEQARQQANINAPDEHGFSPIHWASFYGQISTVKILLRFGANVNQIGPELVTPLHLAAAGGHHEIIRILLQHGSHVDNMDIVSSLNDFERAIN